MSRDADKGDTRAVVLLSGGMDSATVLALAAQNHDTCYALSFAYGQRHNAELAAANHIAQAFDIREHRIITLDETLFNASALVDATQTIPDASVTALDGEDSDKEHIPPTYVPARNLVFLSMALAFAETKNANAIYIGVNAVDYSGYPDCRPEFIEAFERVAHLATRVGVEGAGARIHAPLIKQSKADIIKTGMAAGVDYALTVSCYRANDRGEACGACDACALRRRGFEDAGVKDPTRYVSAA